MSDPTRMFGAITGIYLDTTESARGKAGNNRIASPDLWEHNILKGANVLHLIDDPSLRNVSNI